MAYVVKRRIRRGARPALPAGLVMSDAEARAMPTFQALVSAGRLRPLPPARLVRGTIREVLDVASHADARERAAIVAAERAARNRKGVIDALSPSASARLDGAHAQPDGRGPQ